MEYAKKIIKQPNTRNFIDYMIMYGKRYYFISKVLPNLNTPQHLSYTDSEYNWAETNEAFIWRYFIEKELLYKTDKNLLTRFIYPAPFSKFYLETDRQTTAEIGKYIGYKIVKSFIENNDTNLNELITLDANTIFKRSKYKPKK